MLLQIQKFFKFAHTFNTIIKFLFFYPDSEKGIDGHKSRKGIRRHLVIDNNGYPLYTRHNGKVHDSKGAIPLMGNLMHLYPETIQPNLFLNYLP